MGDRMEATNRLRWSYRRQNMDTGWPVLLPVLQQLWMEVVHIPPGTSNVTLTYPSREEWRDVPTEEE